MDQRQDRRKKRTSSRVRKTKKGTSGTISSVKKKLGGVLSLVLAALLLLTFGKNINPDIPDWSDVLAAIGFEEDVPMPDGQAYVDFVDVGQGDFSVIRCDGHTVLIDAGDTSTVDQVLDFLQEEKIETIDYLFISHPHADHIGAAYKILQDYQVGAVVMSEIPEDLQPTSSCYLKMLSAMEEQKVEGITASPGDIYEIGDGRIFVVGPVEEYSDLNNCSLVLRFAYGSTSFLFTGDMEQSAENDLMASGVQFSSDVLKVGHHGSSTSSGEKFIQEVSPQYAVISCGADNSYGFPHRETIAVLGTRIERVLRTDTDGTVSFVSDGTTLTLKTEK